MANTLEELEIIVRANTSEATSKLEAFKKKLSGMFNGSSKEGGDSAYKKKIEELQKEIEQLKKQLEELGKKSKDTSKKVSESVKPLSKISTLLKGSLFFNLFSKLMIESANGIKDLAKYSTDFNKTMSSIKSGLLEARNAITASYAPAIQALEPIITSLTNVLFDLFNALARVSTILFTNKTSFTKAKKVTTDYAKSLNNAGKEAKGMLASFDELNVISQQNGTDNGIPSASDMFEEEAIDPSKLTGFSKFIYDLKQDLKDIDFTKLTNSFERLKVALQPFTRAFFDGLYWFKDNILVPFSHWAIEKAIPAFFDLLTAVLKVLHPILEKAKPLLQWLWDNFLLPVITFVGDTLITFIENLTGGLEKLADFLEGNTSFEEFWDSMSEGEKIALAVATAIGVVALALELASSPVLAIGVAIIGLIAIVKELHENWDSIRETFDDNGFITTILDLFESLWEMLEGFGNFLVGVFTGDWDRAWKGAEQTFTGFINVIMSTLETVVNGFIFLINGVLDGVNRIIGGINDIAGTEISKLNLVNYVQFPRLAKGGVIKESTPIIAGEYAGASSNPEIVSPQSLMYETNMKANVPVINSIEEMTDRLIIALQELGVYAEFDYDKMRVGINKEQRRVGNKFYGGAYV